MWKSFGLNTWQSVGDLDSSADKGDIYQLYISNVIIEKVKQSSQVPPYQWNSGGIDPVSETTDLLALIGPQQAKYAKIGTGGISFSQGSWNNSIGKYDNLPSNGNGDDTPTTFIYPGDKSFILQANQSTVELNNVVSQSESDVAKARKQQGLSNIFYNDENVKQVMKESTQNINKANSERNVANSETFDMIGDLSIEQGGMKFWNSKNTPIDSPSYPPNYPDKQQYTNILDGVAEFIGNQIFKDYETCTHFKPKNVNNVFKHTTFDPLTPPTNIINHSEVQIEHDIQDIDSHSHVEINYLDDRPLDLPISLHTLPEKNFSESSIQINDIPNSASIHSNVQLNNIDNSTRSESSININLLDNNLITQHSNVQLKDVFNSDRNESEIQILQPSNILQHNSVQLNQIDTTKPTENKVQLFDNNITNKQHSDVTILQPTTNVKAKENGIKLNQITSKSPEQSQVKINYILPTKKQVQGIKLQVLQAKKYIDGKVLIKDIRTSEIQHDGISLNDIGYFNNNETNDIQLKDLSFSNDIEQNTIKLNSILNI